jgi:hypothetical protein
VNVEALRLPCTEPRPPTALTQALHGPGPSHDATSQASASATRWPAAAAPRARAICWPTLFMNIAPVATFMVPKLAHGWPLMVLSACAPCAVLNPARAAMTVAKSPEALANERSSA